MNPTPIDRTAERLTAGLHDLAGTGRPDYRDDILRQVARTRQRPRWTFLERWIPMTFIAFPRTQGQPRPVPRTWRLLLVAGLLLALAAGLVAGATRLLWNGPLNAAVLVPSVDTVTPLLPPGGPTISRPGGIDVNHAGQLVVPDVNAGKVLVLAADGTLLQRWGETGSGPGQLQFQRDGSDPDSTYGGAAWLPDGTIAVADPGNARVQVFSADGGFLHTYGGYGAGDGQFLDPIDVAAGADGSLYVVDDKRNDITVLAPDGTFARLIGRQGAGPGELDATGSISVDANGGVYNADWGNGRVQWWGPDGAFRWSTTIPAGDGPDTNHPLDVDVGLDGFGYATTQDGRLLILSPEGAIVGSWTAPILVGEPSPLFVAVADDGTVYASDFLTGRIHRLGMVRTARGADASPSVSPVPASPAPAATVSASITLEPPPSFPVRFTITAPSDWRWREGSRGEVQFSKVAGDTSPAWFIASVPVEVFADPCHPDAGTTDMGTTAGDLAEAIAAGKGMTAGPRIETTIGGHPAVVFDLANRLDQTACADPVWVQLWANDDGSGNPGKNGRTLSGAQDRLAVVDVDGTRVVFWTLDPGMSLEAVREAGQVFDSLTIP